MWQSTTLRDDFACIDGLFNSTGVPFCHEILQIKGASVPKREVNMDLKIFPKKLSCDLDVHIGTSMTP
jgi:hypothetical protein